MYKITIKNRRTYKGPGEWICSSRSPLGNPFVMDTESDREDVIKKYKFWISRQINLNDTATLRELNRLFNRAKKGDLNLICWCAPKPCHGDVIKKLLEEMLENEKN